MLIIIFRYCNNTLKLPEVSDKEQTSIHNLFINKKKRNYTTKCKRRLLLDNANKSIFLHSKYLRAEAIYSEAFALHNLCDK